VAIVDAQRLNRFLGSPDWDDDQLSEAEDTLDEVEDELANRLNTLITPEERTESARLLASGLLMTGYPVFSASSINGQDVPDGGTLPAGWVIQDHYLRAINPSAPGMGFQPVAGLSSFTSFFPENPGLIQVPVTYQAGWGNVPALRQAILRKAGIRFNNRNDHTVVVRDLDATEPPALGPEDWTDDEIAVLSRFYNHQVRR
jgi:hypothetical protein